MGHRRRTHIRGSKRMFVSGLALLLPLLTMGVLPVAAVDATTAHTATLPGVTLLRPIGARRRPPTSFDANADLRIEIFKLDPDSATGAPVGPSFATTPTGDDLPIRVIGVDGGHGKYRADWNTSETGQPNGTVLRVEIRLAGAADGPACNAGVSLDAGCIAYFDVGLHKRHRHPAFPDGLKSVLLGRTLPIKFYVAQGALTPTDAGASRLDGDPGSPAADAIPNLDFEFSPDDYAPNPDLGGLVTSFDTLFLIFKLGTTVAQANDLLASIGAHIIGGRTGAAGEASGILWLRVPTTSAAEMDALINQLRANPIVQTAVQDSLLDTTVTTKLPLDPNDADVVVPDDWTWEVDPQGGNWGLEAMRVPEMWNLNSALSKPGGGREANIGVIDVGFYPHPVDLVLDENVTPDAPPALHGTHVAGTIAATYNNGLGVDGVDPYAHLVVDTYSRDAVAWGLAQFLEKAPDLDIVNISLGYNWYKLGPFGYDVEALLDPRGRDLVANEAAVFEQWEILWERDHTLPLIVAAAGNDSGFPYFANDKVDAKWASPWNYAALVDGIPNVLVVEAVQQDGHGGYERTSFSNVNGNVSAPGMYIESTGDPNAAVPYFYDSGTSMAAPHVAGLAGYLKSLDPTLTVAELKYLLTSNTNSVGGGASPMVDAFDAAMSIDSLRNGILGLSRLVDIDDGTVDGNLREVCWTTCTEFTAEDYDFDGGPGDGSIDMSDFRRWRDWLLEAENPDGLALDGDSTVLKKDLNGDEVVLGSDLENIYPRGDFNGSGSLSRSVDDTRYVRGHVDAVVSDLEVLQSLFNDPDVSAGQLPNLINSGDLHVDTSACMTDGISYARTKIIETADDYWYDGRDDAGDAHEYTEPVDPAGTNWTVRVEAFDENGNVANVAQKTFLVKLGGDYWFAPTCGQITLTPKQVSVTLNVGESTTPSVELASTGVAANWEFINSVENVEPALNGGSLAAGEAVALDPTITCPDTAGSYGGLLYLQFTDEQGGVIKAGVPEYLAVDLVCLPGGVTADPTSIEIKMPAGQVAQRSIVLTNHGRALTYEADPSDHVAIDDGGSGTLARTGLPGDQAVIDLTVTCPDTPGVYSSQVALTFEHPDGSPVTETVPDTIPVNLTCLGPLTFVQQWLDNASNIGPLYNRDVELWQSEDGNGTGAYTHQFGGTTITTIQNSVPPIGFGTVSSSTAVTASVDPYGRWPSGRAVSVDSSMTYVSSFDATTASFNAIWTHNYSQSQTAFDPVLPEGAFGYAIVVFDITKSAHISASWTCDGEFTTGETEPSTRLIFNGQNVFANVAGQTSGCSFEGTLESGEYRFQAFTGISRGENFDASLLSVTRTHGFSVVLTFQPDPTPGP